MPNKGRELKPNRFRIDEETGCWVWLLCRQGKYGSERSGLAHRNYYKKHKGPIPDGMQVDHLCRNTLCVNPDHLEAVPQAVNIRRGRVATLSQSDVLGIKDRYAAGENQYELAAAYGVTQSCISRVITGENWRPTC
jgi:HNH endonuclease